MSSDLVIVHYNGQWMDEVTYERYEVCGIFHKYTESLKDLREAVEKMMGNESTDTCLKLQYQIKEGYKPITTSNEMSLQFYKALKRKDPDYSRYPICASLEPKQTLALRLTDLSEAIESRPIEVQPLSMIEYDVLKNQKNRNLDLVECAKKCSNDLVEIASETMECVEGKHKKKTDMKQPANLDGVLEVRQTFSDKEEIKKFLSLYAIKHHFQFMVVKSCRGQYYIRCIDTNCSWKLKASKIGCSPTFKIRKVKIDHSCSFGNRMNDKRQATSSIVGFFIQDKFDSLKTNYTPADIIRDMRNMCDVNLSYKKAWRSRIKALDKVYGNPYVSYQMLPGYLAKLMEANPRSVVKLKTDESKRFEYVFISMEASINGWEHCRPIIIVDGTFLKATYGGTLITASTQDAAGHILPLPLEWSILKIRLHINVSFQI